MGGLNSLIMENYFDKIENYLAGTMPAEERSSFEAELAQNKELKDTLEAHRLANDAIEVMVEDNLRTELKKMQAEVYPIGEKGPSSEKQAKVVTLRRLWPRLAAAASVLLLIGFFTFQWAGNNYNTSTIAGNFYDTTDLLNVRGDADFLLEQGLNHFRNDQFAEAADFFRAIPDSVDLAPKSRYYLGLSLEEQGLHEEARQTLQSLIADADQDDFLIAEKAEWLILLTYLNAGETESLEFTTLLEKITEDTNHSYYPKAIQLKQQMNSVWRKLVE